MLWGAGTAVGEIPPYAFSYHAAKAGIRNEEWDSIFAVRPAAEGQGLLEASINRMKSWMLGFIQTCAPWGPHDEASLESAADGPGHAIVPAAAQASTLFCSCRAYVVPC